MTKEACAPIIIFRGGPGVGKSTLGSAICDAIPRSALVEQDQLRYMIKGGLVASRSGIRPIDRPEEYFKQCRLADINSLCIARNMQQDRFAAVIAGFDGGESSTSFLPSDDPRREAWYPDDALTHQILAGKRPFQVLLDPSEDIIIERWRGRGFDDQTIEFVLEQNRSFLGKARCREFDARIDTGHGVVECMEQVLMVIREGRV